jgi:large subunit ribosomal protein L6
MSRVGKHAIAVPSEVKVNVVGNNVSISGKLGSLECSVNELITVDFSDDKISVNPINETTAARAQWGTAQRQLKNAVLGVSTGFTYKLELIGVGYRAQVKGNTLVLQLGFSHDVNFEIPEGMTIKCEKPTFIALSGADKQGLGQLVAKIRAYRPPEPYKGKGIHRVKENGSLEFVMRKEGKKK